MVTICENSECEIFPLSLPKQASGLFYKSVRPRLGNQRGLLLYLEINYADVVTLW